MDAGIVLPKPVECVQTPQGNFVVEEINSESSHDVGESPKVKGLFFKRRVAMQVLRRAKNYADVFAVRVGAIGASAIFSEQHPLRTKSPNGEYLVTMITISGLKKLIIAAMSNIKAVFLDLKENAKFLVWAQKRETNHMSTRYRCVSAVINENKLLVGSAHKFFKILSATAKDYKVNVAADPTNQYAKDVRMSIDNTHRGISKRHERYRLAYLELRGKYTQ